MTLHAPYGPMIATRSTTHTWKYGCPNNLNTLSIERSTSAAVMHSKMVDGAGAPSRTESPIHAKPACFAIALIPSAGAEGILANGVVSGALGAEATMPGWPMTPAVSAGVAPAAAAGVTTWEFAHAVDIFTAKLMMSPHVSPRLS
jgi:hypothetical protein